MALGEGASTGDRQVDQRDREIQDQRRLDPRIGVSWNHDVQAMLTDLYQLTMAYAYWKAGIHEKPSTFEVFFRKAPFRGSFTVLAGVDDVVRFVNIFRFNENDRQFVHRLLPHAEPEFLEWLAGVDGSCIRVWAVAEGELVYPVEPVIRVEGPLAVVQLLETTVLTLVNFASLMTTNAARYRLAAGADKTLLEFGLRRAQGADGGMSASRFSYLGGFDATSNVRAAQMFGLPASGTHAHAYVTSFSNMSEVPDSPLAPGPKTVPPSMAKSGSFKALCESLASSCYELLHVSETASEAELAAFVNFALAFPSNFVALIDTYDVLLSGLPNFLIVATALMQFGYTARGVRLDSGDLAYLSLQCRRTMKRFEELMSTQLNITLNSAEWLIVASNSINEEVLQSLGQQEHAIEVFGIGTNLVTCYEQPALGMVFKLCEIDSVPVMKISQEIPKTTLPGCKDVYRFYDKAGCPILDFIDQKVGEVRAGSLEGTPTSRGTLVEAPEAGQRIYCQSAALDSKRCYVIPSRVESLLQLVWDRGKASAAFEYQSYREYLDRCRARCIKSITLQRPDVLRPTNPTPYKISMSKSYSELYKELWDHKAPVRCYE